MIAVKHICNHSLGVYAAGDKYDPTRTITLRKAFVTDISKRFRALRGEIRRVLVDKDLLGLGDGKELTGFKTHAFGFETSADKVNKFMLWLQGQVDDKLLQVRQMPQFGKGAQKPWTDLYIQDSYARGVQRARYEMGNIGMAVPGIDKTGGIHTSMGTPFHMERVALLYTRTYTELKNITNEMSNQLSKVLSQGMIDGDGPLAIARKLNKTISGTGKDISITDTLGRFIPAERRAKMLARTEVIRAHHMGNIQEYKSWGVLGVKVQAEFRTANDGRECERCSQIAADGPYTLDEIEGMIPAHPNCFIDKQIPIYTSEGWKPIGDVEIGDLVLTHKRRFKKVYALPRHQEQANVVTFKFKGDLNLSMTENHPVLVEGGTWKPAKDCVEGEKIMLLGNTCNHLGDYQLVPWEVESIKHWKMKRKMPMYNLSVEEDESYVAKGVVVHNCRCMALPVNPEDIPSEVMKSREEKAAADQSANIPVTKIPKSVKTKSKPKKTTIADDGILFKEEHHQQLYNQYKQEAEVYWKVFDEDATAAHGKEWLDFKAGKIDINDTSRELSKFIRTKHYKMYKNIPVLREKSFEDIIRKWQDGARSQHGISLRYMELKLEQPPSGVTHGLLFRNTNEARRFFRSGGSLISEDAYIKVRAYNQQYMRQIKGMGKPIDLLRGTNGETGKRMHKHIDEAVNVMKRTSHQITDSNLVGYTDSYTTAKRWGHKYGGVTIQKSVNLDDIVLHKDLIYGATHKFRKEREYIVRGFKWTVEKGNYVLSDKETIVPGSFSLYDELWETWKTKYLE